MSFDLARALPIDHPYRWNGKRFVQTKLWQPSDLPGSFTSWFDASDAGTVTASGGLVSGWSDKLGNKKNLACSVAANQPTLNTADAQYNGLNTFSFTDGATGVQDWIGATSWGVDQFVLASKYIYLDTAEGDISSLFVAGQTFRVSSSASNNGVYTIASVTYDVGSSRVRITTVENLVADESSSAGTLTWSWLWDEVFMVCHSPDMSNSSRPTVFGDRFKTGEGYVIQFDNDTPQDATPEGWLGTTFYANGKKTSAAADAALANSPCIIRKDATLADPNSILIGSDRKTGSRGWTGKVAEFMTVTNPSADLVNIIEGYLAWKWGLVSVLPSDHVYKNRPPLG